MADLFNQQISATYSGLLKTSSSGVLSASLTQITDGRGNGSPLYISTTVGAVDGAINFYNAYTFPSADGLDGQVLKTDGAGVLTWENDSLSNTLNFSGGTGTGSVTLDTQTLAFTGTANQIVTSASSQAITLSFPTAGVTLPDGSIATTQTASDNSTKVATTAYVEAAVAAGGGGDVTKIDPITANQIAVWNDSTDELRSDPTIVVGTDHSITLLQTNAAGTDVENYNIGGGNVPNNDSSPSSATLRKNTGFGKDNLNSLTDGLWNVAVGHSSLKANTGGASNVAIGYESLLRNITGGENVAIGLQSMQFNLSGDGNVAIGRLALGVNTADKNTSVGWKSGTTNTSGQFNSYLGCLAGAGNTTGDQNVAIGNEAAYFFVSGNNTSIGAKSLYGVYNGSTGDGNTVLGYNSGFSMTTGSKNVIIGSFTGFRAAATGVTEYSIIASSNNIVLSDGDGNVRQSFDSTGAATFSGNVGIGISPTAGKLQVNNGTDLNVAFNTTVVDSTTTSRISSVNDEVTAGVGLVIQGTPLVFNNNAGEAMRISSGGVVGIGTTTTQSLSKLNVNNESSGAITRGLGLYNVINGVAGTGVSLDFYVNVGVNDRCARIISTQSTAGNYADLQFQTSDNAAPATRLTISSDGVVTMTRTSRNLLFNPDYAGAHTYAQIQTHSGLGLKFATNGDNDRLTISSGGDVLFRATAMPSASNLVGSAFKYDSKSRMTLVQASDNNNLTDLQEYFNSNGAVGKIQTNGSATLFTTSSDYRLKENVTPITDALSRVNQLKPSRFNFIADADKIVDGFLAHEVQDIIPEAISGEKDAMKDEEFELTPRVEAVIDEDGNVITEAVEAVMETRSVPDYQGIDQSKIVPLLTAAIQEQQTIIEDLKARIETLEG